MNKSNLSYGSIFPRTTKPTLFHEKFLYLNISSLFMSSLPKSSCKLVAPTVEALSWEPSRCVLPFLASREALVLSTVTWDGVLDGWLFTWEVEGWEAWLRASWRLLEEKGEGEEVRSDGGQRGTADIQHHHREEEGGWHRQFYNRGISGEVMHMLDVIVELKTGGWNGCKQVMILTDFCVMTCLWQKKMYNLILQTRD